MINEEYVTRHFCVWKIHIKSLHTSARQVNSR